MGEAEIQSRRFPTMVRVNHDGLTYQIDVDEEIRVDPQNLKEAWVNHPGRFAWYATVHAAALHLVEMAKMRLDVTRSEVASEFRQRVDDKGKSPSETKVLSMLDGDTRVKKALGAFIEAKRQESILKAVREAFTHRRDMLIQLGASEREERRSY